MELFYQANPCGINCFKVVVFSFLWRKYKCKENRICRKKPNLKTATVSTVYSVPNAFCFLLNLIIHECIYSLIHRGCISANQGTGGVFQPITLQQVYSSQSQDSRCFPDSHRIGGVLQPITNHKWWLYHSDCETIYHILFCFHVTIQKILHSSKEELKLAYLHKGLACPSSIFQYGCRSLQCISALYQRPSLFRCI